ncbi:MAG TPA: SWIM zinc finger family protein, partial [Dehalococcoidia bacterium]|nr:SWIM zinc finger family protein [Dehalococcoidia bacterium]
MSSIPKISTQDIRHWVDGQSFQRGQQYFRDGAVLDHRRRGMKLKALCEGSLPSPYRVEADFDSQGITAAHCSCPVGASGRCKHVAALLLAWEHYPEEFTELQDIDASLERRSKAELIALVKQILRQEPELETLLETPLPVKGKRRTPMDPEPYRRQAAAAFRLNGYEWGAQSDTAQRLEAIAAIGDGFAEQHDYGSAASVYGAISEVVLEHYESSLDEDGELAAVIDASASGLGRCLAGEKTDAATRQSILRAMFAIYSFDVDSGGIGLGEDVPEQILELASPEERRMVASWTR